MLTTKSFFDLSDYPHATLFDNNKPVWEALNNLKNYMDNHNYPRLNSDLIQDGVPLQQSVILHEGQIFSTAGYTIKHGDTTKGKLVIQKDNNELTGAAIIMAGAILLGNKIDIGKGALVEGGSLIKSPAIIGECTEVRQGAYLRGYCLTGKRCVVGHTTEVKHSIFLNDAKAGHFAYLGDSILGQDANLGAGTKFANLKFLGGNVSIRTENGLVDTGRRKFGAILGDGAQTGCNSVTNPGTIIGQEGILMPNTTAPSGYHKPKTIIR
jgi:bifunctional N-acetylglucosamine-1-phosphate-uridyltransferase/glucosamine-1-phosphate-acetyltransferase GlmU-like protein